MALPGSGQRGLQGVAGKARVAFGDDGEVHRREVVEKPAEGFAAIKRARQGNGGHGGFREESMVMRVMRVMWVIGDVMRFRRGAVVQRGVDVGRRRRVADPLRQQ